MVATVSLFPRPSTVKHRKRGFCWMERLALRVAEAAEALGISRSKMYELVAANKVPSMKVGGVVRIPADAFRAWIAAQAKREQ